jgi:hypothetical protein
LRIFRSFQGFTGVFNSICWSGKLRIFLDFEAILSFFRKTRQKTPKAKKNPKSKLNETLLTVFFQKRNETKNIWENDKRKETRTPSLTRAWMKKNPFVETKLYFSINETNWNDIYFKTQTENRNEINIFQKRKKKTFFNPCFVLTY